MRFIHARQRRRARTASTRSWTVLASSVALVIGGFALAAGSASAQTLAQSAATHTSAAAHTTTAHTTDGFMITGTRDYRRACAVTRVPGHDACMVLIRTNVPQHAQSPLAPNAAPVGVGYGPSSLQSAYVLPSSTAGSGQTVAVVDAMDDPNAASDLATYRSSWGLPACGSGCFSKVNQNGAASPLPAAAGTSGWDVEESLDIDMVSAICPLCHIILVESNSATTLNLGTAVNSAVSLGATYVSNSYGGSESTSDNSFDTSYYNHPGKAIVASAGDSGYGVSYPAASADVVSVGGTSLSTSTNSRGWTERVWGSSAGGEGTGSGCSADSSKPSWQADTGCSRRTDNDVSAVADPNTGVAVYDTYSQGGWLEVGGTSASSPIIASVFALAGTPAAGTYPASYIYAHTSNLFDVTSGADGSCSPAYLCTGEVGYDGPTGWGTPNGLTAFSNGGGGGGNTVTVTNPGNQTGTVGTAASLQIHASDSASGQTLTYSATGLPAGLSINSSTGLISGTPTTANTYSVTVTATDTTGAHGSAAFTWTISSSGGCTSQQLLGNPGFETGSAAPWTSTAGVINPNGAGETAHSGSWYAWLDGYGFTHTDTLSQTVTIPSGCTASFSFWLHIDTAETTTTTKYDNLTITANGITLATFSNLNHASGYQFHSYPLTGLTGSVTVKFSGTEDVSLQTSFVVDDTAVNTS